MVQVFPWSVMLLSSKIQIATSLKLSGERVAFFLFVLCGMALIVDLIVNSILGQ